ncbi:hypothetical protein GC177_02775 [bacterium]|nr:hypothetical protein [bacterium]
MSKPRIRLATLTWGTAAALLGTILALEGAWFYLTRDNEEARSFSASQRVVYDIKSGIYMRSLEKTAEAASVPPAEHAAAAKPEGHAAAAPEAHAEHAAAPASAAAAPPVAHAAPGFSNPDHKPELAVVLVGLGLSQSSTDLAMSALPSQIGLSFSPYAPDLRGWVEQAKDKGFEVFIDLPMEPDDYPITDPGPRALLTAQDEATAKARIEWLGARSNMAIGFTTPVSEKFMDHRESVSRLYKNLQGGHALLVRSEPGMTEAMRVAGNAYHYNALQADIVLDETITREAIENQLNAAIQQAKSAGRAVVVARPYPLTVKELEGLGKRLEKEGVLLAPVSAANQVTLAQPASAEVPPAEPATAAAASVAPAEESPAHETH